MYMLCGNCEDLFSEKETWFANKVFHPYLKKEKTIFEYDKNLAYFITSVNWRSLYLDILDFVEHVVDDERSDRVDDQRVDPILRACFHRASSFSYLSRMSGAEM